MEYPEKLNIDFLMACILYIYLYIYICVCVDVRQFPIWDNKVHDKRTNMTHINDEHDYIREIRKCQK